MGVDENRIREVYDKHWWEANLFSKPKEGGSMQVGVTFFKMENGRLTPKPREKKGVGTQVGCGMLRPRHTICWCFTTDPFQQRYQTGLCRPRPGPTLQLHCLL